MATAHPVPDPRARLAPGTRERLLDAAEMLFAQHGVAETSLRAVTASAGANLASVNHHFGSKQELFRAVVARRLGPVTQERERLLAQAERAAAGEPADLERIIEAFIAPVLRLRHDPGHGGESFMRIMGRVHSEPGEWTIPVLEEFRASVEQLVAALRRAPPETPICELYWQVFFMIGATAHTTAAAFKLKHFAADLCDPDDVEATLRRLTAFLAAGFRAPSVSSQGAGP